MLDSTTYAANDANSPWCSIGRAAWGSTSYSSPSRAQAAAAGDVVLVTAGNYTTPGYTTGSACRWLVALNPANSGASGRLITFRGVGTVNISLATGSYGPTIGADGRDYIVWDNVRIDESAVAGRELCGHGPGRDPCKHRQHDPEQHDSRNVPRMGRQLFRIRLEATNHAVVANNTIHGFKGNWGHNDAAVMTYDAANSLIEHNHIHGCQTGIFLKGDHAGDGWPQENNIVRFNRIVDCTAKSLFIIAGNGSRIYQNIIRNGDPGFRHDGSGISDVAVVNNSSSRTTAAGPPRTASVQSLRPSPISGSSTISSTELGAKRSTLAMRLRSAARLSSTTSISASGGSAA